MGPLDWWRRRRRDADFAEEIESHLAMESNRLIQRGMSAEDARLAARRAFGNPTTSLERFREARPGQLLSRVIQDVRHSCRTMRRAPLFTATIVGSFAIGIGANATMFATVDTLLLRTPRHVRDADLLHRLYFQTPNAVGPGVVMTMQGYKTLHGLRERVSGFDAIGAIWTKTISSGVDTDARPLEAVMTTASFFPMLGVRPALGRFFQADEERDEGEHVAVLGFENWQSAYSGDTAVLGRTIDVEGIPYTVIGVSPSGFTGVDWRRVDVWLPLGVSRRLIEPNVMDLDRGGFWLEIIARRRPDVTVSQATDEVTTAFRDLNRGARRYDDTYARSRAILGSAVAGRGPTENADARISVWLGGVSILVLLIAAANVATLLLLRGVARARELALRRSLGASRGRLVQMAMVEGMLFAVLGAGCALLVSGWSASAMQAFLLPGSVPSSVLTPRLVGFTAFVAILAGLTASVAPAMVATRTSVAANLGSLRSTAGPRRLLLQRVLITGQVALAMVLLTGAGLFVSSLRNVNAIDLGVDVDQVAFVSLQQSTQRRLWTDPVARREVEEQYARILDHVRQLPGVVAASVTNGEPLNSSRPITFRRHGESGESRPPIVMSRMVGSGYFTTMGTPLVQGRSFATTDHVPGSRVAIVDENLARDLFPGADALGECVYLDDRDTCAVIIGVARNTVQFLVTGDQGMTVYVPREAWPDEPISMMEIRTHGPASAMVARLRAAIHDAVPGLPWVQVTPMRERVTPQFRPWRLGATVFTAFGGLAVVVAAMGLYGLLAFLVAQRTQEIGIRKALGAPQGGVIRLVVRGALALTFAGLAAGAAIALVGGRAIASQLYGVGPADAAVMASSALLLIGVAVAASLIPALRATRISPVIALRSE